MKSGKPPFYLSFVKYLCPFFILIACSTVIAENYSAYETKYSTIYYSKKNDLSNFSRKIRTAELFGFLKIKDGPSVNKVDEIVERVETILDMYPNRLHFNIFLYTTYKEVEREYRKLGLFGRSPIAFYAHKTKAIYISVEDITDRVLSHEIAHALINLYFAVPPPAKMQEILAQYVDRHLLDD